jgi:hypothetical protein
MEIEFDYTEVLTGQQVNILREGLKQSELTEEELKEE